MTEATPHRYTAELANTIEQKWQAHWREHGTFNAPNPVGPLAPEGKAELPKDKSPMPAMPGGGMGGMDF